MLLWPHDTEEQINVKTSLANCVIANCISFVSEAIKGLNVSCESLVKRVLNGTFLDHPGSLFGTSFYG